MSFLPVGRRRPMQSQVFKTAQDDFNLPELDSDYMSGVNIPVDFSNQPQDVSNEASIDEEDLKSSIFQSLEDIGLSPRVIREKHDSIFSQTLKSDGSLSGFFLIPTFTAEGKISIKKATDMANSISTKYSLEWQIEEVNNNYKVKFDTMKQESAPESSFDQLGGKTPKTASVLSELLEERKNLLYNKLRNLQ
ncbi:hypothetical protein CMI47_23545 [Candidatus Pacearchaeota archaeon]|jgi:hypothetical protein|nr:hypothetical protein [Candidatus Pacearchaeota archaeon]|tara:strand:+ start:8096 stop:8671 length:576 start_codon:yes stop_codon:yes gene_type:complete